MTAIIDYQQAYSSNNTQQSKAIANAIPAPSLVETWANAVLKSEATGTHEITVRFTDEQESQALNSE